MKTFAWIVIWTFATLMAYKMGVEAGRTEACKSIHTERVSDKCIEVIREEIK